MKAGVDYIGVGVGALIFNNEGRVLLAKRGHKSKNEVGKWEFPGGAVQFNERCEDAIKREIREEFGIEIEVVELLEVADHIIPDEHQHWVSPSYVTKLVSGVPQIREPEKCSGIKWVEIAKIDSEEISIVSRQNLGMYFRVYGK